jgi:hypothetical protein
MEHHIETTHHVATHQAEAKKPTTTKPTTDVHHDQLELDSEEAHQASSNACAAPQWRPDLHK